MNKIVKIGDALVVVTCIFFAGMVATMVLWFTGKLPLWIWGMTAIATLGAMGGLKICTIALQEWLEGEQ